MTGHFQDVKKLMEKGVLLRYAWHFAGIWPRGAASPSLGMQGDLIKCNILWKDNPTPVIKTLGKSTCALYNRERMEIIKLSWKIPELIINYCSKIHGARRHNPRFQRYHEQNPNADEPNSTKKSSRMPKTQKEEELSHLIQMRGNP
jgi:hypothetical protein